VNRLLFVALIAISLNASAQYMANDPPGEMSCLGLLRALPARQIPDMKPYYENIHEGSGKEIAEKLQSLAASGNKDAQFTLSIPLLTGRCVPQDICAARKYRGQSRGSSNNWEKKYPIPKEFERVEADTVCN
jgi:hypothetical protein